MTSIEETKALAPWTETLPPDWLATRLDAVADVLFSNVDKHTIEGEVPVRLCNYVDVYKNERITGGLDFMEASAEPREIKKFQIRPGDVLATKDSEEADDIAISALVAEELPGVLCGYHLALIRPRFSTVSGPFLSWLHSSKAFRAQYEAKAVGVTRFGLSQYAFRAARVPLPPLPEQERIAAYLDASCAAIDAAVAAKRRQLETLDALRKAITLQAVTRGLNPNVPMRETGIDWIPEIPAHWDTAKLTSLFWFRKGARAGDITQKYIAEYPGEFPVFSGQTEDGGLMGSIDSFEFNFDSPVIFVTTVGAKAMSTRLVSGKFSVSQNCALIIPWHQKTRVDYFEPTIQELFDFERRSIALIMQPSLRFKDLKKFRLPLPPATEQAAICAHLAAKLGEAKQVANSIETQIATLTAYRKSLIHECVTGQRRITESDTSNLMLT